MVHRHIRKIPKKHLPYYRYGSLCIALVALVFLSVTFLKLHSWVYGLENMYVVRVPPPMPTAIDPNFETQVDDCFLPVALLYGYDLRITAGFRSLEEQTQLYDEGRTVDGHIVTEAPAGRSIHNYGLAVDVVDKYKGYDIDWDKLIQIGAYCGLESGGPGDLPHFEHRGGLSTADLAAGERPAPLTLPCPVMSQRASSTDPLTLNDLQSCGAPTF